MLIHEDNKPFIAYNKQGTTTFSCDTDGYLFCHGLQSDGIITSGTAKNSIGQITLYGSGGNYVYFTPGSMTSNVALTLPTRSGTIPSISVSGSTMTIYG